MRRLLATAVVASVLLVGWPSSAEAKGGTWKEPRGTVMVGDSLTFLGEPFLRDRGVRWRIDGVGGRNVGEAPEVIRANLRSYGIPRTLVVALGTNLTRAWGRGDYRDLVRMVPGKSRVFFVTTWRDHERWGWEAANQQAAYTRMMKGVARWQPNVHLIPWRAEVLAHPWLVRDGTHPRNPDGLRRWAWLVDKSVERVVSRG